MTMTGSKSHSRDYVGREDKKIKKRKKPATARGIPRDNPLTPFNMGDLYNALDSYCRNKGLENTRRCDTVIVICV